MNKDFETQLIAFLGRLTGAVVKTVTAQDGLVAIEMVPEKGSGNIPLSEIPDVLRVAEADMAAGTVTLLAHEAELQEFVQSWNMTADNPRIRRFLSLLKRDTRCDVLKPEFRNGELLYDLVVPSMDFAVPEFVCIEGVDFRTRTLYCYTFLEDINRVLETAAPDPFQMFSSGAEKLKS